MEENKNKNKKKPRYDYNDYTDSSGYKYNKISILEAIVQSYRVITDEGDDNSLSNKDRGNNNMEIGGYIKNYEGFNVSKALEWAKNNVGPKSVGRCARYVRSMLEAGGMNTEGRPVSAYQYAGYLPKKGFKHIASLSTKSEQAAWSNSNALPGDIAVMAHGQHGHICMFTGKQWVSDFVQNNMWPYSGDGLVNIFRYG